MKEASVTEWDGSDRVSVLFTLVTLRGHITSVPSGSLASRLSLISFLSSRACRLASLASLRASPSGR